jgi:predicted nucleotidyltransferase
MDRKDVLKDRRFATILRELSLEIIENLQGRIEKIILFGSAARGTISEESDIDILVVVDEKDDEIVKRIEDFAFGAMQRLGILVSPTIIGHGAYADMKRERYPMIMNVEREGISLV